MKTLLKKLQPFMHIPEDASLSAVLTMEEPTIYDLKVNDKEESVGIVQLNSEGHLENFAEFTEEELDESRELLTKDKIQLITEKFLSEFYPQQLPKLHLDAANDLDYFYVFEYLQKDEQFNLPLPNSGITFFMFKNGSIMDMTNQLSGITIEYPKNILPAERAKEIFTENLNPKLKIVHYNDETFMNGDNSFALVYDFITDIDIDVKMDGIKTTLVDLGDEPVKYMPIPEVVIDSADIFSFINLQDMENILTIDTVKVWSKQPLDYFKEQNGWNDEDLVDMDYGIEGLIKIKIDTKGESLTELISLEDENDSAPMSLELAYDKALEILFTQFPDAHLLFKKQQEDHEVCDFDDEGEQLPPHAYQFTFTRFEKDIEVVDAYVSISLSANTLDLIKYYTTNNVLKDFSNLVDVRPQNQQNAIEAFKASFEMKRNWAKNYEDDMESSRYELVYLPIFKGTGGHIHYITAVTLAPWIVDIGE